MLSHSQVLHLMNMWRAALDSMFICREVDIPGVTVLWWE